MPLGSAAGAFVVVASVHAEKSSPVCTMGCGPDRLPHDRLCGGSPLPKHPEMAAIKNSRSRATTFYARYPKSFSFPDASRPAPHPDPHAHGVVGHNGGPRFRVILRNGGRLEARFRELGQVLNLGWAGTRVHASETERRLLRSFCGPDLRLIYANTGAVGDVLEALDPLSVPVITHVHELETMLAVGIGRNASN